MIPEASHNKAVTLGLSFPLPPQWNQPWRKEQNHCKIMSSLPHSQPSGSVQKYAIIIGNESHQLSEKDCH